MLDKELLYFDSKSITASENSKVINTGKGSAIGIEPLLIVQVEEDFTAAGAATLSLKLQSAIAEAFGTPIDEFTTKTFALADLKAGNRLLAMRLPFGMKEFTRIAATVATGPFTAGKLSAFITLTRDLR